MNEQCFNVNVINTGKCLTMDNKPRKKSKKKSKKSKKKKKPINDEEAAAAAEQAKRDLCESLVSKTDLTAEELIIAHEEFHEKYPSGEINKKQFLDQSTAGTFLAEALFRVFDEDGSGNLDFSEFVQVEHFGLKQTS